MLANYCYIEVEEEARGHPHQLSCQAASMVILSEAHVHCVFASIMGDSALFGLQTSASQAKHIEPQPGNLDLLASS